MEELTNQDDQNGADERLLNRRLADYSQWNRIVFAISTAAIGVTAIIPLLVTTDQSLIASPLLVVVWSLFAVTTFLSLLSSVATRRAIRSTPPTSSSLQEEEPTEPPTNMMAILNLLIGMTATTTFLAAIICFVVFMGMNTLKGAGQAQNSDTDVVVTGSELPGTN